MMEFEDPHIDKSCCYYNNQGKQRSECLSNFNFGDLGDSSKMSTVEFEPRDFVSMINFD